MDIVSFWCTHNRISTANLNVSSIQLRKGNSLHQVASGGSPPPVNDTTMETVSTSAQLALSNNLQAREDQVHSLSGTETPGLANDDYTMDIEGTFSFCRDATSENELPNTNTSQVGIINQINYPNIDNNNYDEMEHHSFNISISLKNLEYCALLLILLMKLVHDLEIGALLVAVKLIACLYFNAVVKREVAKHDARRLSSLLMILSCSTICIFLEPLLLTGGNHLASTLIFIPSYDDIKSFWNVLCIVTIIDINLIHITIMLKSVLLALSASILAFHKKGKYYFFIESVSQLYRILAPILHWLYYLYKSYSGSSKIFCLVLSGLYFIAKGNSIMAKTKVLSNSVSDLLWSTNYGVKPPAKAIKKVKNFCPICQYELKSPIMLRCRHIFCEECAAIWFDRETTCPMCRAIIVKDPIWRNGATSCEIQVM